MTVQEFEQAVRAHFGDPSAAFLERIRDALPTAIARFCQQWQWEFLDKYTTFGTETSTTDASGKTVFDLPNDFYKIIVVWISDHEVQYRTRTEWAQYQRAGITGNEPQFYTVIGKQLVLSADSSETIYAVYTRTSASFGLDDIPAQYHYAIQMAVHEFLTPGYVQVDNRVFPNPAVREARQAYLEAVQNGRVIEGRTKGRGKRLLPAEHLRRVNDFR